MCQQQQGDQMKKFALLLTLMLTVATAVFAAGKNSATVNIREKVTVGATTLPAGEYKVSWSDAGQVTFAQGKTTVATVPAKVSAGENSQVSVLTDTQGSSKVLSGSRLKSANLTFGSEAKSAH
jgi:hypothetical protein